MKNAGHGEKTVHIITAAGFFVTAALVIFFPQWFGVQGMFASLFFLLGLKTVGNIIMDAHNTIHYYSKKNK